MALKGWGDSDDLAEQCIKKADIVRKERIYLQAVERMNSNSIADLQQAELLLKSIVGWKDSAALIESIPSLCEVLRRKEALYLEAVEYAKSKKPKELQKAVLILKTMLDWKDSIDILSDIFARTKDGKKLKISGAVYNQKDGVLYWGDESQPYLCIIGVKDYEMTEAVIEKGCKAIFEASFRHCSKLMKLDIPQSVVGIGSHAFEYCNKLTSVTIGGNIKKIKNSTFAHCAWLRSVTIENGVQDIDLWAFGNCPCMSYIYIPNTIKSIGRYAFTLCTRLTDVYYKGSATDWKKITIDADNSCLMNATIHYNS